MIYFFIDIGGDYGYGNLFRCLPIHLELIKKKIKSTIVFNTKSRSKLKIQKSIRYNWHKNIKALKISNNDTIIVDSYNITLERQKTFKKISKNFFVIDDYGKTRFKNEKIIDWSISSHAFKRLSLSRRTCIIGSEYAPLRPTFSLNHKKFCVQKKLINIIIIFGGSDVNNLTMPLLKILIKTYPDFKFTVVSIQNKFNWYFSRNKRIKFVKNPSEKKFVSLLLRNDLAIASGGHLLFELACIGMPTIHVKSTKDQIVSVPWKDTGFTRYAGSAKQRDLHENIIREIKYYNNFTKRSMSSKFGSQLVDGKGANRLAHKILSKVNDK